MPTTRIFRHSLAIAVSIFVVKGKSSSTDSSLYKQAVGTAVDVGGTI